MPIVQCPHPGCDYATDDVDPAIAGPLLTVHGYSHMPKQTGPDIDFIHQMKLKEEPNCYHSLDDRADRRIQLAKDFAIERIMGFKTSKNNLLHLKGRDNLIKVFDEDNNEYSASSEDLCKCVPGPPCPNRTDVKTGLPKTTPDFLCNNGDGGNGCEPGKTRHEKMRNVVRREWGVEIIEAGGVQEGQINTKSFSINKGRLDSEREEELEKCHIREKAIGYGWDLLEKAVLDPLVYKKNRIDLEAVKSAVVPVITDENASVNISVPKPRETFVDYIKLLPPHYNGETEAIKQRVKQSKQSLVESVKNVAEKVLNDEPVKADLHMNEWGACHIDVPSPHKTIVNLAGDFLKFLTEEKDGKK